MPRPVEEPVMNMRANNLILDDWKPATLPGHFGACFSAISKAGMPMTAEIGMIDQGPA